MFDGTQTASALADQVGMPLGVVADIARGLELAGLLERRAAIPGASVLVIDDEPDSARVIQAALGPEGCGCQLKMVRDRIGAQLLMRRQRFDLVLIALDRPDQEPILETCREQAHETTRFIGLVGLSDEEELARLDAMGLDGILHRPLAESDLKATLDHLLSPSGGGVLA
jgi:CheY-like chemotaxis protein